MYNYNVGKSRLKEARPLIYCITNHVAMSFNANALNALGASPIMSLCPEEAEDLALSCKALLVNIGTMDSSTMEAVRIAAGTVAGTGTPWVFDPAGAPASKLRKTFCKEILALSPTLIRGNPSEIISLAGGSCCSKGVDSAHSSADALESAVRLSRSCGSIVSLSGETDYITDGERIEEVKGGSPLMSSVSAMGCTASAISAAFLSVGQDDCFLAAVQAMELMADAGERAASICRGPGSLQTEFLDQLYLL